MMRTVSCLSSATLMLAHLLSTKVLSEKLPDHEFPPPTYQVESNKNQLPLHSPSNGTGQVYTAKITDFCKLVYLINVEAGTPPQAFRASIDVSFSEVFVPSTKCATRECSTRYHRQYNSTKSETYRENGTAVSLHYGGVYSTGFKSQDTFWVAGLEVKQQEFEEVIEWYITPFYSYDEEIDTVLGLSRLHMGLYDSDLHATGLWHNIIAEKLLKRNIFSLKLSKSPDTDGEIMLGGINQDLFDGDLHPVKTIDTPHDPSSRDFGHGWQVPTHSLTFDDIEEDLSAYTAVFQTNNHWFQIPYPLWDKLKKKCGAVNDPSGGPDRVPCEKRRELPDLVIRLGVDGEEVAVTISAWDYILEMPTIDGKTACALPWGAHRIQDDETLYIVLATAFLGGIYSVWDQDEATISFAKLKQNGSNHVRDITQVERVEGQPGDSSSPFAFVPTEEVLGRLH